MIIANGSGGIIKNSGNSGGGGIKNFGILALDNSIVSNNYTENIGDHISGSGGGIYNSGILTVSNSTVSNNDAPGGGGIYNSGTLTVNNSTLMNNGFDAENTFIEPTSGGGIYNIFTNLFSLASPTPLF